MIALLLLSLQILSYSQECIEAENLDFTFYLASGTDDWIVSERYPNGAPATVLWNWAEMPNSKFIWENFTCTDCTITVTKSFFLLAPASEVILYMISDDDAIATINNQNSCSTFCCYSSVFNVTPATKLGLNELKIVITNYGGPGYIAYMLVVNLKI